jgi:[ribosomal protein S18]-alanine N-acetyltransferase
MTAPPARLRPARRADLDAIVALDRATDLAPHWPITAYAAILTATRAAPDTFPLRCLIVAEPLSAEGTLQHAPLAGFAVGLVHPAPVPDAPRIAELEDVVVAAHCRRTGIGRALCSTVLDWCRSQGATEAALEVRAANSGAIALYMQLSFEQVGRRPSYYCDPQDDAIAMRLRWSSAGP